MGGDEKTILVALAGLVAPILTYLAMKHKDNTDFDKEMQKTNIQNAQALYEQYSKMNQALQEKVDKLQSEYEKLLDKYDKFQDKYEQETNFYKSEIERLENQIEVLETDNAVLTESNAHLQAQLDEIKGENNAGITNGFN